MTTHMIYICDRCEKEIPNTEKISWGIDTHYCRQCAKLEIADMLNISIYTVISHRKNIVAKTGIKSVAGLTVYALINNLISESDVM